MLADFGTHLILFMVFFFLRARNPVEKTFWLGSVGTTIIAVLATANRGATAGLFLGMALALVYFRRTVGAARIVLLVSLGLAGLYGVDLLLSEKTIAVSVFDRMQKTEFEGIVPENRTMTWKPALDWGMESPIIGHGPFYDTGVGLTKRFWPHNGYIFYFVTIGMLGLSGFIWILVRVFRESQTWRVPSVRGSPLGDFMAIAQIWLAVLSFEQLRTDHQREDIYPYIVWMCFGVVIAGAAIARRRLRAAETGLSEMPRSGDPSHQ
jgi:O-antigen ligase